MKKKQKISRRIPLLFAFSIAIIFTFSCKKESQESKKEKLLISQKDYFPDKIKVKYAQGFEVSYHGNYKVVKLFSPYKNSHDTLSYVLIQRGTPKPAGFPGAQFVNIPVKTFACLYTTHIAFTDILESNSIVKGFASPEYVINPYVKKGLAEGTIINIGNPDDLNIETLMALHPELLMVAGGANSEMNKFKTLMDSGIKVLVNSEWMETTPLGRAEWFKLLSVFLNKEVIANRKFNQIEEEYLRLKKLTQKVSNKPSIITGLSFKDAWYVPGGKSFMSHFIVDAGAIYPWISDSSSASFPLNFEVVYEKGLQADFWVNPEHATSKEGLLQEDKRYGDFKAFKNNNIFSSTRRMSENGSREYWETGIVNPHLILADLIKIFHPELLPDHELYYYQQLQ